MEGQTTAKKPKFNSGDVLPVLPLEIWILITTTVIQSKYWIQNVLRLWKTSRRFQKIIKALAGELINHSLKRFTDALPLSQENIDTLRDALSYERIFKSHAPYRICCKIESRETRLDEEPVKRYRADRISFGICPSYINNGVSVHSFNGTRGRALVFITPGLLSSKHSLMGFYPMH